MRDRLQGLLFSTHANSKTLKTPRNPVSGGNGYSGHRVYPESRFAHRDAAGDGPMAEP